MSIAILKPPHPRKGRRRESLAETRMRLADEQVRDPKHNHVDKFNICLTFRR